MEVPVPVKAAILASCWWHLLLVDIDWIVDSLLLPAFHVVTRPHGRGFFLYRVQGRSRVQGRFVCTGLFGTSGAGIGPVSRVGSGM